MHNDDPNPEAPPRHGADDRPEGGPDRLVDALVATDGLIAGNPTGLFGVLWATGGAWTLLAWALGAFDDGWTPGPLLVGVAAVAIGALLIRTRVRALATGVNVGLTLLGSAAVTAVVLWGGPTGGTSAAILYVYAIAFAHVATPRWAWHIIAGSAAMHLAALLWLQQPGIAGRWVVTWGATAVIGLLLGVVVARLATTAARLRRADEAKDRFLAVLSHELRTPIAAAITSAETLLDPRSDELGADQRDALLRIIHHHASRQLALVEDLLELSLDGDRTRREPSPADVSLVQVVATTCDAVGATATVSLDPAATVVRCDRHHLERVLTNLLVNASRYGRPPLLVTSERDESGDVVVSVMDHGPGIAGGLASGVLEPFTQGGSGDRGRSAGIGLGLTICHELVEANGGSLGYRDTPGGGATMTVRLPAGTAARTPGPPAPTDAGDGTTPRPAPPVRAPDRDTTTSV